MHSSHSLRRPCLFILSLSIALSFSLSISSFSFCNSRSLFYQVFSSRSLVSRFSFYRPAFSFEPHLCVFLFSKLPSCSLAQYLFPPLRYRSSSNQRVASLRLRASSRSLSVFSFHITVSFSVSLSPGWSMLFFHPSAWLAHRFISVSPWRILFRRCLYIATGWYAGAYIIRRARVRVYVQGFARQHTYVKLPRYVCISVVERPSLARSSWECIQGNIAYTCANWFRYACTREMRKNGRMYRLVLSVYRDTHVHPVWHPCIKCAHACVTRTRSVEDLPSFLRVFFSYRSTLKYAPIDFYWTLPNHRSHAVALLVHAL